MRSVHHITGATAAVADAGTFTQHRHTYLLSPYPLAQWADMGTFIHMKLQVHLPSYLGDQPLCARCCSRKWSLTYALCSPLQYIVQRRHPCSHPKLVLPFIAVAHREWLHLLRREHLSLCFCS